MNGNKATSFRPPMFYVYHIENLANNKLYIGKSMDRRDKNARWTEHKRDAQEGRTNMPIHKSMKKYCEDNFVFNIVSRFGCQQEGQYQISRIVNDKTGTIARQLTTKMNRTINGQ